ncbi:dihydrolipoyl dehydrogenase [Burkholderiales bacterium]|jgi:dihydrolipoamide dehydrogenase|nr:dihydrolipoyl dehydrogenase [Burkholderiales bacterium]MDC3408188.1 dihydrolipoyl dehydrogenase [Burkholderiales bacterium]
MDTLFDVAVIGAGPGGYVAAIRAAQLGLRTVCIDDFKDAAGKASLGGTCLNVGCIPSKALLESSENYEKAIHKFHEHGITASDVKMDVSKMLSRKNRIVKQFTSGISLLFKKNKVTNIHGSAEIISSGELVRLKISGLKEEYIEAKNVIIATGSSPREMDSVPVDNEYICDNKGALSLTQTPKHLLVIGAGVIGLEMGSVWKRLGAKVTVLEALPNFLGAVDESVSKEAKRIFTKNVGLDIHLGCSVQKVTRKNKVITVTYTEASATKTLECDRIVVAVGRVPNSDDVGLDNVGIKVDERGFITVDHHNRTNVSNIYAIGDVVRGPMLAHKSSEEGVAVAETISGQYGDVNLDTIPWVIYTSPEIAWVGQTEQALKEEGVPYKVGKFPFVASGRAQAIGDSSGFVKMIAHEETDRILGVHVIGPYASELISEAVVAMEFGATSEDIARIVHAHPSLSEAMHEAALGIDNRYLSL